MIIEGLYSSLPRMYSISRHLVTLHSGSNLRQMCIQNGIKSIIMPMSSSITSFDCKVSSQLRGKRQQFRASSKGREPSSQFTLRKNFRLVRSCVITGQCRCYTQSAENLKTKGKVTASEEEGASEEKTESSVTRSREEEVEGYDKDDFGGDEEDGEDALFLTDKQIQIVTGGDPELVNKIKYLQLEFSVMRQDGEKVPSKVPFKYWSELIHLNSKSKRLKYYLYLFKTEMKQLSQIRKKEIKREERLKMFAENPLPTKEEDPYGMVYALARNTLFLRLYDTTVTRFYNSNAARAMLHHPPLIIDCSYDEYMNFREAKNCAEQIELCIAENRVHKEPLNLYLCNAGRNTKTMNYMHRMVPTIADDGYPINLHEESFMDLFPKKRLVYLTPHTRDELEEYNEDDIYIIGAMVDKSDTRPHSLAKAKTLGLTMRRLPLDKHLMWGLGGKSLTINQMVRIMLDVRYNRGDWATALKHVPMRKLCRDFHPYPNQVQNEENMTSKDGPIQGFRKEKRTSVFEDFELLNRRKGFRRSEKYAPMNFSKNSQRVQPPKVRSLFQDDE